MYSDSFILTTTLIYKNTGYNEYAYNFDIKLIPFETCLIHKPILRSRRGLVGSVLAY